MSSADRLERSESDLLDIKRRDNGCFVSKPLAVILVLVGCAMLAGVVLITYFAHPDYDKKCTIEGDYQCYVDDIDEDIIWEECTNISIARDECKYDRSHLCPVQIYTLSRYIKIIHIYVNTVFC